MTAAKKFSAHFGNRVWCLYLYAALVPDGTTAIKIGISNNPYRRVGQLNNGMPFDAIMLWDFCRSRSACTKTERMLHKTFRARHMRGEWFRFENSKADKSIFHARLNAVFEELNGRVPDWKTIDDTHPDPHGGKRDDRLKEREMERPKMSFGRSSYQKCRYCDAPLPGNKVPFCDKSCAQKYKLT